MREAIEAAFFEPSTEEVWRLLDYTPATTAPVVRDCQRNARYGLTDCNCCGNYIVTNIIGGVYVLMCMTCQVYWLSDISARAGISEKAILRSAAAVFAAREGQADGQ